MEQQNALWIIGILIAIILTSIALLIQERNSRFKLESRVRRDSELKEKISKTYNKPRDINADRHLIQVAQQHKGINSVRIMGINSLGVVHQAREDIMRLLSLGKKVQILLLNPYSEEFNNRIRDFECKSEFGIEDFQAHRRRLIAEWNATIMILRTIGDSLSQKGLIIKARNEKPAFAMSAAIGKDEDACFAYVNEYADQGRGTRGRQFLVRKYVPAEKAYETYIELFNKSFESADDVNIFDNYWIL